MYFDDIGEIRSQRMENAGIQATEVRCQVAKKKPAAKKQSKKRRTRKPKPGSVLEESVARIQALFDPNAKVTLNEWLEDCYGLEREYDVVVRGVFAGHPGLMVIECKDWKRRVEPGQVNAFNDKSRNVLANFRIMVSKKGFSKPAIELASKSGVGTLSLIPDDPAESGWSIGTTWYAKVHRWEKMQIFVEFDHAAPQLEQFQMEEVLWQGKPVTEFFFKLFSTTYVNVETLGPFNLTMKLDKPRDFMVRGNPYRVKAFHITAERTLKLKRKWVSIHGEGFYDWQKGQVRFPSNSNFTTSYWKSDFSDWDDFEGMIPESNDFFHATLFSALKIRYDEDKVPDLDIL